MLSFKLQTWRTEINEKAKVSIGRDQIVHYLNLVGFRERTDGFQLAKHIVINDKIGNKFADDHIFVAHGDSLSDFS